MLKRKQSLCGLKNLIYMNLSVVIVCFLRFLWECYAVGAPLTSCFNDEFYEDEYHDVIEILYASIHRKFPANIVADSPVLRFPAELLTNAVGSFLFKVRDFLKSSLCLNLILNKLNYSLSSNHSLSYV